MKKTYPIIIASLILALLIFPDCAQVGTLTGGDKDTVPPVITESEPQIRSVNFEDDRIRFSFDEFFVLDNMRSNFYASPPLESYPEFKIRGKDLIVQFNEELKDSVTYFLNFGSGIKDFNEGNKLENLAFVLATGEQIDSMRVSGKLLKAFSLQPEIKVPVFLYRELQDSVPAQHRPYYYTLTDSSGNYTFNYLRPGTYKVFSLQDNDGNLLFNLPNERIAFLDSFLTTSVKTEILTDTFEAGKAVSGDTLLTDSIFNRKKHIYSPQNVYLFSFEEDHQNQYVHNFERPLPGQLVLQYNLPGENTEVIFPYAPISEKDSLMQFSDSLKTQNIWLTDTAFASRDSIFVHVQYPLLDSLGEEYIFTDSLLFLKQTKLQDSSVLRQFEYEAPEKIGYFEDLSLKFEAPLLAWDTTKINVIQLIDTAVDDPKKQDLKAFGRPERDVIYFKFERRVDSFSLAVEDSTLPKSNEQRNAASDSVWYKLSAQAASKDTLEAEITFDNRYFFSQTQNFSKEVLLTFTPQKITYSKRRTPELFDIHFIKPQKADFSLKNINTDEPIAFETVESDNQRFFSLRFTQPEIVNSDTLLLRISAPDGPFPDDEMQTFEKELTAVFVPKKQYIKKAERVSRQGFYLLFNREISPDDINITQASGKQIYPILSENDSLYFDDIKWKPIDSLKINVNYKNERNRTIKDSFVLVVETKKKEIRRRTDIKESLTDPSLQKIVIEKEIPFTVKSDSSNHLKYYISAHTDSLYSYRADIDSAAFTDVLGRVNMEESNTFEVLGEDDYGTVSMDIKNIGNIARKDFYRITADDSIISPKLTKGQLILYLYDKEEQLVEETVITQDTTIVYKRLLPMAYSLKAFWDSNADGKWNTGDYFKNLQPERVLIFPKEIPVKPGWELIYEWNILFKKNTN
jgi:uncharacterized protein (DUF2141 family)